MSLLSQLLDLGRAKRDYISTNYGDIWCRPDIQTVSRDTGIDPASIKDVVGGCAVLAKNSYLREPSRQQISLADIEIKNIRYNKEHRVNNKTFFCDVYAKKKRYTFFVKVYNDSESMRKDLEIISILEGAGVAMLPREEGDRTLIYSLADGSLEQCLGRISPKEPEKKKALLEKAADKLVDFYACASVYDNARKLREHGVKDKDLSKDILKFLESTCPAGKKKTDRLAWSARETLEAILDESILPRLDPEARRRGSQKWSTVIHNDAYEGNIIVEGSKVRLHDFEKIAFGPIEYDLATLLVGLDAPNDMKNNLVEYTFERMVARGVKPRKEKYKEFKNRVHAAMMIRGLRVIGWLYSNYENLTRRGERENKSLVKSVRKKLNNLFRDVLISAFYFDDSFETVRKDEGTTARAILDYANRCLDKRIEVKKMYNTAENIHNGLPEPGSSQEKQDRGIRDSISEMLAERKKGILYATLALAAVAAVSYGAISCGKKKSEPGRAEPPVPVIKTPAPTTPLNPPDPQPEPAQKENVPPPYAQRPGNLEGTDPHFCRRKGKDSVAYILNDDSWCVPEEMPVIRECDEGFVYNPKRVRCDNPKNPRLDKAPKVRCPSDEYIIKRKNKRLSCIHRKVLKR